jgi:hypothetical protein
MSHMDDLYTEDGDTPNRTGLPDMDGDRIRRAAWAFTTRRVPRDHTFSIGRQRASPRAGDLVLARIDVLGYHRALQLRNGRRRNLFPGDEVVVAYGNRYAPSQFEAIVPKTLGPCHLVAGGGVAAKALSWHSRIAKGPTLITPIGYLLHEDGERANLRDYAMETVERLVAPSPTAIAVVGTAMDSGKTASAAFLVRGLSQAGMRVGYAKVTGTGAGGDTWLLRDAGAFPVVDFTDAGFVSTYRVELPDLERILVTLIAHMAKAGVDAVVLEVADGILQAETAALLESPVFKAAVGGVFFAAADAMGAVAGLHWLKQRDLPVAGLGGVLTAAPLQSMEATAATGVPTYTREELEQAHVARAIIAGVRKLRMISGGADARTEDNRERRERVTGA